MGLEFQTAGRRVAKESGDDNPNEEVEEWETFKIDDVEYKYQQPGEGQVVALMALTERRKKNQIKITGIIDFFFSILDEESESLLYARLFDPKDSFDVSSEGGINDILDALLEDWGGRPTRRSPDSVKSLATTGH